jgi:hypothetical protein
MGYINRTTPAHIERLEPYEVFVFGSNLAGRHGKGAAKTAREKFGAKYGQAEGLQGSSYAIPFKDGDRMRDPKVQRTLSLTRIAVYADSFIEFAKTQPELTFLVVEVGCHLAGYTPQEVAPLFKNAADVENIHLPASFWRTLDKA